MIQVKNLVKRYGEKEALRGISFSIAPGEVVGLLGLNGAGKSTTMSILTGYISASAGSVSIDGHDIANEPAACKKQIGYLPEQFSFYPDMRVSEYLDFVCDLKGFSADKAKRKAHLDDICARVGISKMTGRMIRNLSKGYRQRVGFAQALVGNPKVLILDEPTVGLDPSQIIEIRQLIKDSGKESTVIVSSHILSEIQAICSRVIVIHEGRVIADDAPDRLMQNIQANHRLVIRVQGTLPTIEEALNGITKVRSVKLLPQRELGTQDVLVEGKPGADLRADVFFALAKANLPLLHTYGGELSLEDVFLHLTGRDGAREEAL